jgi:hypothetical protein
MLASDKTAQNRTSSMPHEEANCLVMRHNFPWRRVARRKNKVDITGRSSKLVLGFLAYQ